VLVLYIINTLQVITEVCMSNCVNFISFMTLTMLFAATCALKFKPHYLRWPDGLF